MISEIRFITAEHSGPRRSVKVWQVVPLAPQVEAPRLQALQALWETQTFGSGKSRHGIEPEDAEFLIQGTEQAGSA